MNDEHEEARLTHPTYQEITKGAHEMISRRGDGRTDAEREGPKIGTAVPAPRNRTGTESNGVLEQPRLVFFYRRTSGLCRRVEGYLAQVLQQRRNHSTFKLIRVDVDAGRELSDFFGIDELPTLVVVQGKQALARIEAPRDRASIERALSPWLR